MAIHKCSECGFEGEWSESWSWYGSYSDLDGGKDGRPKPILKYCSDDCLRASPHWTPDGKFDDAPEKPFPSI